MISILHFAAPPVVGGVENTIYHHARLLTDAGYQVEILAGRGDQFDPEIKFHRLSLLDSRHPRILEINKPLAAGQIPPDFDRIKGELIDLLAKRLRETHLLIVHNALSLHKNLALTAALHEICLQGALRIISWSHDFAWLDEQYQGDLHEGYPWSLLKTKWPDVQYIVVSEHRQQRLATLIGLSPDQIQVIYPGVAIRDFLELEPTIGHLSQKLDLFSSDPLMLLPARITRRKNIQLAIRITAALKDAYPQVKLLVTGPPGPHNPTNIAYLESLQRLSEGSGVDKQVIFLYKHGTQDQPLIPTGAMIASLYQIADLLLFPSLKEGFGIPALEAGLVRMPIFATHLPSLQESTSGAAHLFDPQASPVSIAQEIINFLRTDRTYRMRKRVLDHFTWQAIARRKLIPLIRQVSSGERQ